MPSVENVLEALERHGLLLKQDKRLPSVVGLVTGESLASSWWRHPDARRIFRILSEVGDHPDVLRTKLLFGKDTFVHRRLWPSLIAVAVAREPWQLRGLTPGSRRLLREVDAAARNPVRSSGDAVRELERRLLVHATEIHTESGSHAIALESWRAWSRKGGGAPARSVERARQELEEAAERIGAPRRALPWTVSSVPGARAVVRRTRARPS